MARRSAGHPVDELIDLVEVISESVLSTANAPSPGWPALRRAMTPKLFLHPLIPERSAAYFAGVVADVLCHEFERARLLVADEPCREMLAQVVEIEARPRLDD